MRVHAYSFSFPSLIHRHPFLSKDPYPTDANSTRLVMKEVEVVVVEVLRVFIQIVKGFGGPIEVWSRYGEATESAALPNELEWAIEAGPFHRSQGGQSVKTSPAPLCSQELNAAF